MADADLPEVQNESANKSELISSCRDHVGEDARAFMKMMFLWNRCLDQAKVHGPCVMILNMRNISSTIIVSSHTMKHAAYVAQVALRVRILGMDF